MSLDKRTLPTFVFQRTCKKSAVEISLKFEGRRAYSVYLSLFFEVYKCVGYRGFMTHRQTDSLFFYWIIKVSQLVLFNDLTDTFFFGKRLCIFLELVHLYFYGRNVVCSSRLNFRSFWKKWSLASVPFPSVYHMFLTTLTATFLRP